MDVIYASGRATAAEVMEALPDPPTYSAVRALLRVLLEKGHLSFEYDGPRYVYLPTVPRNTARQSALRQVLRTFFDGSASEAVAALLDMSASKMTDEELDQLQRLIDQAKVEGR